MKKFIPSVNLIWLIIGHTQNALGVERIAPELSFLQDAVNESTENNKDLTLSQINFAKSQVGTAKTNNLPLLSLSSGVGLNKNYLYDGTEQTNQEEKYSKSASIGISANQKIWNNGQDSLGITIAETKVKGAELDQQIANLKLQAGLTKDLVALLNSNKMLARREKELIQWKLLNENTRKKEKGGLAGAKDTLQSDKELLSAEAEVIIAKSQLENAIVLLNNKYKLERNKISAEALPKYETLFAPLFNDKVFTCKDYFGEISKTSSEQEKLGIQFLSITQELDLKRRQQLSPDLRLTADISANYIDNVNKVTNPRIVYPNWNLSTGAGLKFSINVFSPKNYSLVKEGEEQLHQININKDILSKTLETQCLNLENEQKQITIRALNTQKVIVTTTYIVENNHKLFDAGFLDIFEVVRGMQELYVLERNLTDIQNQNRSNLITFLLALRFGQFYL